MTFALTNGGHNAGIVSEPGHDRRHFRIGRIFTNNNHVPASEWAEQADRYEGSWWPAWAEWLRERQDGGEIDPPPPGTYVKMR